MAAEDYQSHRQEVRQRTAGPSLNMRSDSSRFSGKESTTFHFQNKARKKRSETNVVLKFSIKWVLRWILGNISRSSPRVSFKDHDWNERWVRGRLTTNLSERIINSFPAWWHHSSKSASNIKQTEANVFGCLPVLIFLKNSDVETQTHWWKQFWAEAHVKCSFEVFLRLLFIPQT